MLGGTLDAYLFSLMSVVDLALGFVTSPVISSSLGLQHQVTFLPVVWLGLKPNQKMDGCRSYGRTNLPRLTWEMKEHAHLSLGRETGFELRLLIFLMPIPYDLLPIKYCQYLTAPWKFRKISNPLTFQDELLHKPMWLVHFLIHSSKLHNVCAMYLVIFPPFC